MNQFAVSGECLATDAVLGLTVELDADGAIVVWSHSGIAEVMTGESFYSSYIKYVEQTLIGIYLAIAIAVVGYR